MTDLIKREDAIKAVSEPFDRRYWQYTTRSIRDTVKILKDIPSAENKGEWICQDQVAFCPIECSRCHKEPLLDTYGEYVFSDFCPNCGADMRGANDE